MTIIEIELSIWRFLPLLTGAPPHTNFVDESICLLADNVTGSDLPFEAVLQEGCNFPTNIFF
jgi:hypothetical protein